MVNRDCLNPMDKKENCKLFRAVQLLASVSGTVEGQIIFAVVAKPFWPGNAAHCSALDQWVLTG